MLFCKNETPQLGILEQMLEPLEILEAVVVFCLSWRSEFPRGRGTHWHHLNPDGELPDFKRRREEAASRHAGTDVGTT